MSKSDVQSASVAPVTVPSISKDVNNAPSSISDTSSNRLQDTKTDSLERFRQFHQLRRETQTARLRQLQALEDQLTGAASSNQHRQRSLLSTRGDGRLRTTSLIHDDRKPRVILGERSSDDSDLRQLRKKKKNYAWRLSGLENLTEKEESNDHHTSAKSELTRKSKQTQSETAPNSQGAKQTIPESNSVRSESEAISTSGKRNTLQDLERLIAESARRLTESRRSIDELIQSHEIDTSNRFSGKENYELDFSDQKGDYDKEAVKTRMLNANNVIYNETMETKSSFKESKAIDPIVDFDGLSNRISSNRSASPHHVRKRSLNTEREVLSFADPSSHSSDHSVDILNDLTSMEAKEQSLLPAPLRPSSLHLKSSTSTIHNDLDVKNSSDELRLSGESFTKSTPSQTDQPKKVPPKTGSIDGRSGLRKPQVGKSRLSGINNRESDTIVDWMSSDIDTFQNDLHASKRHEISKQTRNIGDDTASTTQASSLSRTSFASTSSISTNRTRKQALKKSMSGTIQPINGQPNEVTNTKVVGESDSEDEVLVRKNKASNTSKPVETEASNSLTVNNPYRRSLKGSPSLEQLVRTKKVSIHQPATDASKVKESMHGSFVGRDMSSKTNSQSAGHRKRGKVQLTKYCRQTIILVNTNKGTVIDVAR